MGRITWFYSEKNKRKYFSFLPAYSRAAELSERHELNNSSHIHIHQRILQLSWSHIDVNIVKSDVNIVRRVTETNSSGSR